MYYWNYKGTFLILTDSEEIGLVRELGGEDLSERISYIIHEDARRKYERKINRYLKTQLLRDPEAFHRRFVFRCWHGAEAQAMFPKFLDAYGRVTRFATIGHWGKTYLGEVLGELENLVERLVHHGEEDFLYVSLLNRPRFRWLGFRVTGVLSFPRSEITTVTGTVDNFALLARSFHIRFGRDAVRLLGGGIRQPNE
jgi:hypothetical protein